MTHGTAQDAQFCVPGLGMPQQWQGGSSVLGAWECSFMGCPVPGDFGGCSVSCWAFPPFAQDPLGSSEVNLHVEADAGGVGAELEQHPKHFIPS